MLQIIAHPRTRTFFKKAIKGNHMREKSVIKHTPEGSKTNYHQTLQFSQFIHIHFGENDLCCNFILVYVSIHIKLDGLLKNSIAILCYFASVIFFITALIHCTTCHAACLFRIKNREREKTKTSTCTHASEEREREKRKEKHGSMLFEVPLKILLKINKRKRTCIINKY